MTCIAAIVEDGKVWMGGDSAVSDGYLGIDTIADEKVFANGDFLFGITGGARMLSILRHSFSPPKLFEGQDLNAYMATTFVNALREAMKTGGYGRKSNEVESFYGAILVGVRGQLFSVGDSYSVLRLSAPYLAAGCGADLALGSLFTSEGNPEDRIRTALAAAERYSAGVRGPFVVLNQ